MLCTEKLYITDYKYACLQNTLKGLACFLKLTQFVTAETYTKPYRSRTIRKHLQCPLKKLTNKPS